MCIKVCGLIESTMKSMKIQGVQTFILMNYTVYHGMWLFMKCSSILSIFSFYCKHKLECKHLHNQLSHSRIITLHVLEFSDTKQHEMHKKHSAKGWKKDHTCKLVMGIINDD